MGLLVFLGVSAIFISIPFLIISADNFSHSRSKVQVHGRDPSFVIACVLGLLALGFTSVTWTQMNSSAGLSTLSTIVGILGAGVVAYFVTLIHDRFTLHDIVKSIRSAAGDANPGLVPCALLHIRNTSGREIRVRRVKVAGWINSVLSFDPGPDQQLAFVKNLEIVILPHATGRWILPVSDFAEVVCDKGRQGDIPPVEIEMSYRGQFGQARVVTIVKHDEAIIQVLLECAAPSRDEVESIA